MPNLLKRIVVGGCIASVLFGCSAQYVEPTDSTIAFIEFIDESPEVMGVSMYADAKECTDRLRVGRFEPKTQTRLAVATDKELVFTASMDVGAPNVLMAFGALGGLILAATYKGCTPTIEFLPQAGRTYIFRMNSDGNDCSYQFGVKPAPTDTSDVAQPVPFVQREWIRPFDSSGPFCKMKKNQSD